MIESNAGAGEYKQKLKTKVGKSRAHSLRSRSIETSAASKADIGESGISARASKVSLRRVTSAVSQEPPRCSRRSPPS